MQQRAVVASGSPHRIMRSGSDLPPMGGLTPLAGATSVLPPPIGPADPRRQRNGVKPLPPSNPTDRPHRGLCGLSQPPFDKPRRRLVPGPCVLGKPSLVTEDGDDILVVLAVPLD